MSRRLKGRALAATFAVGAALAAPIAGAEARLAPACTLVPRLPSAVGEDASVLALTFVASPGTTVTARADGGAATTAPATAGVVHVTIPAGGEPVLLHLAAADTNCSTSHEVVLPRAEDQAIDAFVLSLDALLAFAGVAAADQTTLPVLCGHYDEPTPCDLYRDAVGDDASVTVTPSLDPDGSATAVAPATVLHAVPEQDGSGVTKSSCIKTTWFAPNSWMSFSEQFRQFGDETDVHVNNQGRNGLIRNSVIRTPVGGTTTVNTGVAVGPGVVFTTSDGLPLELDTWISYDLEALMEHTSGGPNNLPFAGGAKGETAWRVTYQLRRGAQAEQVVTESIKDQEHHSESGNPGFLRVTDTSAGTEYRRVSAAHGSTWWWFYWTTQYSYAENGWGNQAGADFQMHDVGAGRRMQVGDVQLTILSNHCWT